MKRAAVIRLGVGAVVTVAVILGGVIVGCGGGHAPTLPSPDAPPAPEDVIEVEDYVVEATEVVRLAGSTLIRARNTVRIDGNLIGADGSGPGDPGVSITIGSEGDVQIGGTARAGNGTRGEDRLHHATTSGSTTDGGDGGSLTIIAGADAATTSQDGQTGAEGGSITLGENAHLIAGDGADGGDSLTGGAGGQGGSISL